MMGQRAVLLAVLVGAGCSARREAEPVWIGHLAPLSGPERLAGQHARQGVQVAVEAARSAEQTVGGRPLAVRHADTRGKPALVRAEAVRLLAVNKVAALLAGPDSDLAGQVVQAARPYEAPVVIPGELADRYPGQGVLVLGAGPQERGRALARFARRRLKGKRAAVLADGQNALATTQATAFVQEWRAASGASLVEWPTDGADSAALAGRVAKEKPAVVLLAVSLPDLPRWRSALRKAGVKAPLLQGGPDVGPEAVGRALPPDPEVYLATVYARSRLTEQGKKFARTYEKQFGAPPDLYAASAYDGARLLLDALAEANSTRPAQVRGVLARKTAFESLTGPVEWQEGRPVRRVFVVQMRGEGGRVVQTVAAGGK
jgi:branched-chain amino acid transport system substrate-binding protein